jgi:hypothetical protein
MDGSCEYLRIFDKESSVGVGKGVKRCSLYKINMLQNATQGIGLGHSPLNDISSEKLT